LSSCPDLGIDLRKIIDTVRLAMRKLFLLAFLPALALAQVRPPAGSSSAVNELGVSTVALSAPSYTATAASGSDAFCAAQGAKLKLGTATLAFDGTVLAASVGISTPSIATTAASGAVAMSGVNGSKFCPGVDTACFTSNGTTISVLYLSVTGQLSALTIRQPSATDNPLYLKSNTNDGADAEMFSFSRMYSSSPVSGSRIVGFYPDTGTTRVAAVTVEGMYSMDGTDATGSPGAATINQPLMLVAVAASASTVVVTDSLVTATTPVFCQAQAVDATCTHVVATVPAAGSFTVTMDAACTGNTAVACLVHGMF
jgi:hypothetical protein